MLCRKHWKNSVLYVSILFQVAQRSLGLLSVFTLVRNSKAKALTLKEYLFLWHFGHWQQLVLTPYSQFITGHIYRCTGCTSPLEQLCPAGKLGQRAAWQSAAGLWSARYRRFVYMGKSRWTQGAVCTVNLLQEIWDQLGRHVGAVAWMIDWYLSKDFSSFSYTMGRCNWAGCFLADHYTVKNKHISPCACLYRNIQKHQWALNQW